MIARTPVWFAPTREQASSRPAAVYFLRLMAVAVAYFAAAEAGLALAYENLSVTAVWPPTGIALAALVLWGRGLWPGVALGAVLANVGTGVPFATVLGIATGNTLEALVGAALLVHIARFRPSLDRTRDVFALAGAAVVSTMVSATIGVAALRAGAAVSGDALLSTWRTWWLGDLGGDLLVAPFLLVLGCGASFDRRRLRVAEGVGLLVAVAAVSWFVFSDHADRSFLVFPVLAWAALRFRQPGVTAASLLVAAIAAGCTAHGMGPFAAPGDQGLLLSQAFVGISALVSLLLAAITAERERAETALRGTAEARFRSAFEGAPTGMAVVSLDGRFEQVNGALCDMTGYGREALQAGGLATIAGGADLFDVRRHLDLLATGAMSTYKSDKRCRHASGETVWITLHATVVRDDRGEPVHFLVQMLDITDRRRYEENLQYMVDHDSLTGLLNRRSFERELEAHLERGRRYGLDGAALMVDLDHFKDVNDSLGHHAGDELLLRIARALRRRLRETDVLARLSGDEFVALLPHADRTGARQVAREVLAAVRAIEVVGPDGEPLSITASVGVAMIGDEVALTGEDVMVRADLAMYAAKDGGRDRHAFQGSQARSRTGGRILCDGDDSPALGRPGDPDATLVH